MVLFETCCGCDTTSLSGVGIERHVWGRHVHPWWENRVTVMHLPRGDTQAEGKCERDHRRELTADRLWIQILRAELLDPTLTVVPRTG